MEGRFYAGLIARRITPVRILAGWESGAPWVFAVYPNRKFLAPTVRSFSDFLIARFGPEPYWDTGAKGGQGK